MTCVRLVLASFATIESTCSPFGSPTDKQRVIWKIYIGLYHRHTYRTARHTTCQHTSTESTKFCFRMDHILQTNANAANQIEENRCKDASMVTTHLVRQQAVHLHRGRREHDEETHRPRYIATSPGRSWSESRLRRNPSAGGKAIINYGFENVHLVVPTYLGNKSQLLVNVTEVFVGWDEPTSVGPVGASYQYTDQGHTHGVVWIVVRVASHLFITAVFEIKKCSRRFHTEKNPNFLLRILPVRLALAWWGKFR